MRQIAPGKFAAALRLMLVLLLLAMPVLAGGCIEDAEDTEFTFDNENDPNPGSTGDSDDTSAAVAIASVGILSELVIIVNQDALTVDITGWTLVKDSSDAELDTFTFPEFSLPQGGFARVHSDAGTDSGSDLFWDGNEHWNPGDTAILSNGAGSPIASCSDGDGCWVQ